MILIKNFRYRRLSIIIGGFLILLAVILLVFVNFFLEPVLAKKLDALIVQGSDSLYTYRLGKLTAGFFGGNIRVENLEIKVDSNRYRVLEKEHALPALTIELNLQRGDIKGIGFFSLVLGRKVTIREIFSRQADIVLIRHIPDTQKVTIHPPLWKAIQPAISAIAINTIKLDGVKFLYKPSDTSQSVKLQFDRFDALVGDIKIDSVGATDTNRVAFAKDMFLKFHDMKFRTADSSYKMKAEWITYSSKTKTVEIDSFKLQPTLKKEDFYKNYGVQASLYYIEFNKIRLTNTYMDRFLRNNIASADSVIVEHPKINVYLDKSQEKLFNSKIGSYPHQKLLKAGTLIRMKNIFFQNASINYTEKNGTTGEEGTLEIKNVNLQITNATNDPAWIRQNNKCTAKAEGLLLGTSPIAASFVFYLDSSNGRFDAEGSIKNVTAAQLNTISVPLSNTQIPSLTIHSLHFKVRGEDFTARADVQMHYNNFSIVLRKIDEETGAVVTRKFITKLLNRYVVEQNNPGPGGVERKAENVAFSRLTSQSFFGVIWKAVFAGIQKIILKT